MLFIDVASIYSPLNYNSNSNIWEKKKTDKKIQDIVFDISDFVILVVNDFTILDQELIQELGERNNTLEKKCDIIVIHNLKDITNERLLDDILNNKIENYIGMEKRPQKSNLNKRSIDINWYKTPSARHIFLVNDNCLFGREYNEITIQLLRNWILAYCVCDKTKEFFEELFTIMKKDVSEECLQASDSSIQKKSIECDNEKWKVIKTDSYNIFNMKFPYILKNSWKNSFEPEYCAFECGKRYIIIAHMIGVAEDSIEIICTCNKTIIKGEKTKDTDSVYDNMLTAFGKFEIDVKIPSIYNYEYAQGLLNNGILRLEYEGLIRKSKKLGQS